MEKFPREFYLVTGLATMVFIASTVIAPFFSLFVVEEGASPIELGIIVSLLSYTTLVVRLPLGQVIGTIGSWWVVPLALIGQIIVYIFYGLATSPIHFIPIRIFHAIVSASLQPTLISLISKISPDGKKGEGVGIYLTSVGLAMMCGPLLSSVLLKYTDYRTIIFFSAIIPCIAFGIYLVLLVKGAFGKHFSREAEFGRETESFLNKMKGILALRPVQMLTYLRFSFSFTMAIMATIYAVYAVNILNLDPSLIALMFTFRGLSNTLARIPAGKLSDITGRKILLQIAFAILVVAYLLLSETKNPITIALAMTIYGAAHGTRAVNEWAFLGDVVPIERGTLANAYFASVFDLGSAVGSTFAGSAAMFLPTPTILKIAAGVVGTSILVVTLVKPAKNPRSI